MSKFKDSLDSAGDWLKDIWDVLSFSLTSFLKKATGSGMTNADRELSETSLRNQQTLNQEEYDRKIDFYERFESPASQVRQYKEAGLNPMLLAGSGAGAAASGGVGSAGSAPAQSSSLVDVLGSLLNFSVRRRQLDQEKSLRDYSNETNRINAETQRLQAQNYGSYLAALTEGQQQKNSVFFEAFGVDMQNKQADTAAKESQSRYLNEVAGSEVVRRRLMESGIRLNDSVTACNEIQKAILSAQEKYTDRYFRAIAEISEYQSTVLSVEADVASRLSKSGNDLLYHKAVAECAKMIFDAGMEKDIWEGDAFKKAVDGKMTKKDWTEVTMGVIKTLLAGGAVVGASALRAAARAVVPPMPSYTVPSYMSSPSGEPVINM